MSFDPSIDSMQHLRTQLRSYRQALSSFSSSTSTFKVLTSIPPLSAKVTPSPKTLYILDSSFNPPTLAHLRIALSALKDDKHSSARVPKKLVLLLSTHNADKAPKPAAFEQRLVMMEILAHDLLSAYKKSLNTGIRPTCEEKTESEKEEEEIVSIDIALTTHALFAKKALAISSSSSYRPSISQTHLVGYDTLIRILEPKYYDPPNLSSLDPFLSSNRLLVTYRPGASWEGKAEQDTYLKALGSGERENEGGRREWVTNGRIKFNKGEGSSRKESEEVVSSTKVRQAVKSGDEEKLSKLVTNGVKEWIVAEGLYLDD